MIDLMDENSLDSDLKNMPLYLKYKQALKEQKLVQQRIEGSISESYSNSDGENNSSGIEFDNSTD